MSVEPLERRSAVDALADALRKRVLAGELAPGTRLREQDLTTAYDVARHTVRAALRALAAEGLIVIEPHRGAAVAALDRAAIVGLYELRTALEAEAARLALERHGGTLPASVHAAARALANACRRRSAVEIVDAHDGVHRALVEAGGSDRITAAHRALAGEIRLFTIQLPPRYTPGRMAADHLALVEELEAQGPDALRHHLREAAAAVLAVV